jgi:hypothetical protein
LLKIEHHIVENAIAIGVKNNDNCSMVTCHLWGAEYVCYYFSSTKYGSLSDGYLASSHTVC